MGRRIGWCFLILGMASALSSCNNGVFSSFSYPLSSAENGSSQPGKGYPSTENPPGGGSIEIIIPPLEEDASPEENPPAP